jgi:hydrogenase nickel incorporation protein HypA/HybF
MHEYPVVQRIIKIAEEAARESKARKILRINLVVGELSGFIGDSIRMYYDVLSKGSAAEGAEINIKIVKPELECASCGKIFEKKGRSFKCPACGGDAVLTGKGREFYVESVDIET